MSADSFHRAVLSNVAGKLNQRFNVCPLLRSTMYLNLALKATPIQVVQQTASFPCPSLGMRLNTWRVSVCCRSKPNRNMTLTYHWALYSGACLYYVASFPGQGMRLHSRQVSVVYSAILQLVGIWVRAWEWNCLLWSLSRWYFLIIINKVVALHRVVTFGWLYKQMSCL